jgi:hypothetical protein
LHIYFDLIQAFTISFLFKNFYPTMSCPSVPARQPTGRAGADRRTKLVCPYGWIELFSIGINIKKKAPDFSTGGFLLYFCDKFTL